MTKPQMAAGPQVLGSVLVLGLGLVLLGRQVGCSEPEHRPTCGDHHVDEGEECDEGIWGGEAYCSTYLPGGWGDTYCYSDCTLDYSACAWCGDGKILQLYRTYEDCDGENLNGHTCEDLGFAGGRLKCDESCRFDTSDCTPVP